MLLRKSGLCIHPPLRKRWLFVITASCMLWNQALGQWPDRHGTSLRSILRFTLGGPTSSWSQGGVKWSHELSFVPAWNFCCGMFCLEPQNECMVLAHLQQVYGLGDRETELRGRVPRNPSGEGRRNGVTGQAGLMDP